MGHILSVRNGFEIFRPVVISNAIFVIYLESIRDWAMKTFIHDSVHKLMGLFSADEKIPLQVPVNVSTKNQDPFFSWNTFGVNPCIRPKPTKGGNRVEIVSVWYKFPFLNHINSPENTHCISGNWIGP